MNKLTTCGLTLLLAMTLTACFGKKDKGPIAQERERLSSKGEEMRSDGEKLIKEGQALQNSARESRVVANSQRTQADILTSQGRTEEATQLRQQADQHEAHAAAADKEGREKEDQGLNQIGSGQNYQNRMDSLEKQRERINK